MGGAHACCADAALITNGNKAHERGARAREAHGGVHVLEHVRWVQRDSGQVIRAGARHWDAAAARAVVRGGI